jgi:hypothetical protein
VLRRQARRRGCCWTVSRVEELGPARRRSPGHAARARQALRARQQAGARPPQPATLHALRVRQAGEEAELQDLQDLDSCQWATERARVIYLKDGVARIGVWGTQCCSGGGVAADDSLGRNSVARSICINVMATLGHGMQTNLRAAALLEQRHRG